MKNWAGIYEVYDILFFYRHGEEVDRFHSEESRSDPVEEMRIVLEGKLFASSLLP